MSCNIILTVKMFLQLLNQGYNWLWLLMRWVKIMSFVTHCGMFQ